MPRLRFDTIEVIESLQSGDLRTGALLLDEVEPLAITSQPSVRCRLSTIHTREQFLQLLWSIADDARLNRHSPLLQLETHGSPDGLELASGEFLQWSDLREPLTAINAASRLNLLVTMSACDGANLVSLLQPGDRAPMLAVIGPTRPVTGGELERGTLAFYRTLFRANDAAAAWRAMNDAVGDGRPFGVFTADLMFRRIMHLYLQTECTEEALNAREANVERQLRSQGFLTPITDGQRAAFRAFHRDHRAHFEVIKEQFFFCDVYPEHRARFAISFLDCVRPPGTDPS